MIQISEDTAAFLLHVLAGVTLNAGAPDFEEAALAAIKARRELNEPQRAQQDRPQP